MELKKLKQGFTVLSFFHYLLPITCYLPPDPEGATKKGSPESLLTQGFLYNKGAATYSPALHCSTIGASGLNCSVRNGKRWNPAAIATRNGGDTRHKQEHARIP